MHGKRLFTAAHCGARARCPGAKADGLRQRPMCHSKAHASFCWARCTSRVLLHPPSASHGV